MVVAQLHSELAAAMVTLRRADELPSGTELKT
jgi:hypothetical protein